MPSISGIELGADSCVLVRARQHTGGAVVSAVHLVDRSQWPGPDTAVVDALRGLRRSKRFPRRARVVAWGLPQPVNPGDPIQGSMMESIKAAGFQVESVLTPPEALAELARTWPHGRGVAAVWLAVNVRGAAIAIVRDGQLLFGRAFDWTYSADAAGTRAELLRRYSLVAHLAPEVRRAIMLAQSAHGATVGAAVTCGDLPDLRSLTMLLIEELDLEFETLDSTEGLHATGRARSDRFSESASALRLAVAAATAPIAAGRRPRAVRPLLRAAAAAMILGTVAWRGTIYWTETPARPVADRVAQARAPETAGTTGISPAEAPRAGRGALARRAVKPAVRPAAAATGVATPLPPVDMATSIVPLTDPVPTVESIVLSEDRRVAVVGGRALIVGDRVGRRVVAQIDRDAVVLREASGHQIRVRIP